MSTLPTARVASRSTPLVIAAGAALLLGLAAAAALRGMPTRSSTASEAVPRAAAHAPSAPAAPAFASQAELERARDKGLRHFALGENELALQALVPVYRTRPSDDAVAIAIADASLQKRDFKTAQVVIEALRAPDAPDALRMRGALLEQANRLSEALALYERAIPGLVPPFAAMEGRARVLSWMERFDDAIAAYRALESNAEAGQALRLRSRVRIAELTAWKKDFDGALAQLAALIAEQPQLPEALLLQGQILEWQGKYADAKRSYSSVLAFDAGHAEARVRLDKLLWVK